MMRLPKFVVGMLTLALLLGLAMPVLADDAKGTVRNIYVDKNHVVLKGILNDATYHIRKDARVIIDGRNMHLKDLREGDRVEMTYEKKAGDNVATEVRCLRKYSETNGTVKNVITDKHQLILKGVLKDTTYDAEKDALVFINGRQQLFSDLRDNDTVMLTYESRDNRNMVSEIRASRPNTNTNNK